ncbi:MAG: type II toxin-antitoxin system VapC family toxin [Candidatus Sumerlaeota bacterium]|nr:type II toxin-antitoxin system VapC family toxin [Candidatus Sumerlaeota bacterium]
MSLLVVDASVAAKWFVNEEFTEEAVRLYESEERFDAPEYLLLEMDSIFAKRIRRRELTRAEVDRARILLREGQTTFHPVAPIQDMAFELAVETRCTVYDCLYLALAILLGGQVVTADRKCYSALARGPYAGQVVWIQHV